MTTLSRQRPSGIKEAFDPYEFVVFAELVEHDFHPKPLKETFMNKVTPSTELSLTMRVRVFDLRRPDPEVILQEFVPSKPSHP